MAETQRTYEDGLRDGKIEALENVAGNHADRLDSHSARLRWMERIIWACGGAFALVQLIPEIKDAAQWLSGS